MAKFKAGDKALVVDRPDKEHGRYGLDSIIDKFVGKTVTINTVKKRSMEPQIYTLKEDSRELIWPEYLLERTFQVGDKVIGTDDNWYGFTGKRIICEVVEPERTWRLPYSFEDIVVRVIDSSDTTCHPVESKYFKLWEGEQMRECAVTECKSNQDGKCPEEESFIKYKIISEPPIFKCSKYAQRDLNKQWWKDTDKRFVAVEEKIAAVDEELYGILEGLDANGGYGIPACTFCKKHGGANNCAVCPIKDKFGECTEENSYYYRIRHCLRQAKALMYQAKQLTTEFLGKIREEA